MTALSPACLPHHSCAGTCRDLGAGSALLALTLLALAALTPAWPPTAHGQSFERVEEMSSNAQAYFYHVRPGESTMQVEVLGSVRQPGLYVVGTETSASQLLALAGGAELDARQRSHRRTVHVRLIRPDRGIAPLYERELLESPTLPEAPALADGDVLSVEVVERRGFTWRDVFTVVNTVALVALSVERLSNL